MPCSALGSTVSATSPPSRSIVARVASKTSRTPGSIASCASSAGTANRRPFRSSRVGGSTPPSIPTEVESQGSRPCSAPSSNAASVTFLVSGPHWSSEEAKAIIP